MKTKVIIAILIIAIVGAIGTYMYIKVSRNFNKMYGDLAAEEWCEISDDGSSMTIDTNPKDEKDVCISEAYAKIKEINADLGIEDKVFQWMSEQDRVENGKFNTLDAGKVYVKWRNNAYTGLQVTYTWGN